MRAPADEGGERGVTTRVIDSISKVDRAVWNRLANPDPATHNPFLSHEFLSALENSRSAAPQCGWTPRHLLLTEHDECVGAAPVYAKTHSFGEYVFDHPWAEAYERAGGRYYPKLLCAVPFTPVPGRRLLADNARRRDRLAAAIRKQCAAAGYSSAHVNFVHANEQSALAAEGYLLRTDIQFHWINRGYRSFEEFLATLSSRKRKAIRHEREAAVQGLTLQRLEGADIQVRHWDAFWKFYQDTGGRKWGRPYLTREFFAEIANSMPDKLMMVIAFDDDTPIAGALNFIGGDALYGRYWGRTQDRPFLHFEVCYHQAVEFAIERRLARVEAGAQGGHKLARGYEAVSTFSAHWIENESLRRAVGRSLTAEREHVATNIALLDERAPYKRLKGGFAAPNTDE